MIKEINLQHLIILIAIIFIIFYFTTRKTKIFKKEKFNNIINSDKNLIDKKNKTCSQDSINTSIKDYIFSTKPFVR